MKRIFTISALVILAAASNILKAQNCDFAQTGVRYNYSSTDANGNCIINIDLYFDLRTNAGSKYMALHIWPTAVYPNLAYNDPPLSTDLVNATTIVIHHFQEHLELHSVYNPDTQVQPQFLDMILTLGPSENAGYDRFTITNINLNVPGGCSTPQSFTIDMWSTESQSMNQVLCFDKGTVFYANNPRVIGLLNCNLPRTYNVQIFSIDPASMTVNYDVYIDDGDNIFNVLEDTVKIKTMSGIVINNTTSYNSGTLSYPPYSNLAPYANMNLWVEVKSASLPNSVVYLIENSCAALPVKLKSFEVKKNAQSVLLNWVTAGEFSNKGFYIERRIGDGIWTSIGFVNSLADKGNSNSEISYSYVDNIYQKAVIQYRLKQVDINGNFEYSPIRIVKTEGLNSITIFPNPSSGNVNIAFSNPELMYNVRLFNAEGKQVREWQNSNSILSVQNLKPGFYLFRISDKLTKVVEIHKLVVH
jgi:hypothetical protein